jgi:hypothetical protein
MQEIFSLYGWEVDSYASIHQGLINSTYSIQTNKGAFILQSINHNIFRNPSAIDDNINAISNYLQKNNPSYLFTHLVPTLAGNTLLQWEGGYYRAFHKIEGYALSVLDNENQVEQAAMQFAGFTSVLKNFEAAQLKDTLPDFHNLNLRYHQFSEAIVKGNAHRIAETKEAISFLAAHKNYVDIYSQFIHHADVKKRVTHHDTKINNVLFQKKEKANQIMQALTVPITDEIGKNISKNSDAKVIFNGDGSDELSGGYLYMKNCPDSIEFDCETRRLLSDIHLFDVLRSDKCISSHGLEPRTPFLDKTFVNYYLYLL